MSRLRMLTCVIRLDLSIYLRTLVPPGPIVDQAWQERGSSRFI